MQKHDNLGLWLTVFEGEGEGEGEGKGEGKNFTQEEVNTMMASDRKKHQGQTQNALNELQALQAKMDLTTSEREDLEKRVDSLQATLTTKEEQSAREQEKSKKASAKEVETLTGERNTWQKRYTDSQISQAITTAAVTNKGINPGHFISELSSKSRLEETMVDNKGTGEFKVVVALPTKDKDGKDVVLQLSANDAVKRMQDMTEHANLFEGTGKGGQGGNNADVQKKGQSDIQEMIRSDPKAYQEARKKGEITL